MPSIASSATSVLIAHVGGAHATHPARRRRRHAAQPLAADHRRAVRHPRGAVPRADRPRARPRARPRPEHAVRAAPRPRARRPLPAGRARAAGLPHRQTRVPGVDAVPGKGTDVPLYILGSSMFGATSPPRSACPTPSPRTSRPQLLEPAVAAYRREFRPSEQLAAALRDRRRQRRRRRQHEDDARAQLDAMRRIRARRPVRPRAAPTPTRRPTCCSAAGAARHVDRCSPTPPSARRTRSATGSRRSRRPPTPTS